MCIGKVSFKKRFSYLPKGFFYSQVHYTIQLQFEIFYWIFFRLDHHPIGSYTCDFCQNISFPKSDNLLEHIEECHKSRVEQMKFECQDCQISFDTKAKLKYHRMKEHGKWKAGFRYNLEVLDYFFLWNIELTTLGFKSFNPKSEDFFLNYSCSECNKSYGSESNLRRHLRDVHKTGPLVKQDPDGSVEIPGLKECPHCQFATTDQSQLTVHLRKHSGN